MLKGKKKEEYYFDSQSFDFKKVKLTKWLFIKRLFKWSFFIFLVTICISFLFNNYYTSQEEIEIKLENATLKKKYNSLIKDVSDIENSLDKLQDKQGQVYKKLFGIKIQKKEKINTNIKKYSNLSRREKLNTILKCLQKVDKLNYKADTIYKSNLKLLDLSKNDLIVIAHIPNIFPIKDIKLEHIGAGFGIKKNLFLGIKTFHNGQDFIIPKNTPVLATANGIVERAEFNAKNGFFIRINHMNGYKTEYAHLNSLEVKRGQQVFKGQNIAKSGNSGTKSICSHLHYGILKKNKYIDPINYFYSNIDYNSFNDIKIHIQKILVAMD